jgi:uncharacterized protein (TIGR02147 family)
MISVFDYMNYRDFLRDYYEEKKQAHAFYSYRLFAQKAGFKSPNFLKLVIEKKRNLSKESVFKFCKALGLKKKECEYFENLVFFNQSESLEEKNVYLTRLVRYHANGAQKKIAQSEMAYYRDWFNPVIRELICARDFGEDYKKLGQAVAPSISAVEARHSVELLLRLKYIERQPDGSFRKTSASLTTGPAVRSIAVANYHKAMIALGAESIERFRAAQRDIESVTVSVSPATYEAIKGRANEFMMELLHMAENDARCDQIAQVNIQVFPLSAPATRGRR